MCEMRCTNFLHRRRGALSCRWSSFANVHKIASRLLLGDLVPLLDRLSKVLGAPEGPWRLSSAFGARLGCQIEQLLGWSFLLEHVGRRRRLLLSVLSYLSLLCLVLKLWDNEAGINQLVQLADIFGEAGNLIVRAIAQLDALEVYLLLVVRTLELEKSGACQSFLLGWEVLHLDGTLGELVETIFYFLTQRLELLG